MRSFRINILLLAFLTIAPGIKLCGQQKEALFSLSISDQRLEEALNIISDIVGMKFSYNPSKIPADSIISLNVRDSTLEEILKSLSGYGISYRILDKHIVLRKSKGQTKSQRKEPEKYTISGFIKDSRSGEVLIGATIGYPAEAYGAASNEYGYYSLTVPPGEYTLICSHLGYQASETPIKLVGNTELDLLLIENIAQLEEVIITSNNNERIAEAISSGKIEIRTASLNQIPGVLGENDVIKSIQSLPGVNFYSDGSTIFHVRGGDRDQNLIMIDEAPIYNPAHLLGLFSAFTPESIKSINVYRGDMPANYGGRLSSVIDVRLKDGNSNSLVFSGNIGPIASTLNLEGPMFKDRSSFYVSARRSHLKWLVDKNIPSIEKLHFTDFNLKYNFRINRKNRILLSYYSGLDMFRNRSSANSSHGISWENNAGNLRWNHVFNEKLFSNTSIIISNYEYNLYTNWEDRERWNTGVGLAAVKSDFSYFKNTKATYKAGIYLATHYYSPGNYYVGSQTQAITRGVSSRKAREYALYIANENILGERVKINYGLRFTSWQNVGTATEYSYNEYFFPVDTTTYSNNQVYNTFTSLEPRLSLSYKLSKQLRAKLSWSMNSQFEYLVSNSVSPFTSLEAWLPASPNILPMKANQYTAGLTYSDTDNKIIISTEVFYKLMNNYIEYVDHAYMLFNPHIEGEIRYGKGKSYGGELLIKVPEGRLNGWMSYSFSRCRLTIPEINDGRPYPAIYDRPHTYNLFLNYKASPKWNLSATWVYSTGNPITTPTGYYLYNGYQVPFYDKRNNDRLPDYHRLDLSSELILNKPGSRYKHSLRFSIMNLYGRNNPFSINFNKIINESGSLVVPSDHYVAPELTPSIMYIFGMIPSISYKFEF